MQINKYFIKNLVIIFLSLTCLVSMTIYDITLKNAKTSEEIHLSDYKGKVIMIVNTASLCGFTKQYSAMQELWEKYRNKDFILIGVPTNDFGGQEPGTNQEISNFCELNFGIDFLITEKISSKGKNKHPLFELINKEFSNLSGPLWNFYKYIFSKDGKALDWFASTTEPNSEKITSLIERNIK